MKKKQALCIFLSLLTALSVLAPTAAFAEDMETPGKAEQQALTPAFERGNLSSTTGQNSGTNQNPIRSVDFIPLDGFVSAKTDEAYYVRYFAYDKFFSFLGTCKGQREIGHDMISAAAPGCAYIRLLLSNKRGEAMDPENPDLYGFVFRGQVNKPTPAALTDLVNYSDHTGVGRTLSVYLEGTDDGCPQILACEAKYSADGEGVPTIQGFLVNRDDKALYYSPAYRLGAPDSFERKEWRLPPVQGEYDRYKITISIPERVSLDIADIGSRPDDGSRREDEQILYHAHQGFSGLCPASTVYAFEMAGRMGYRSCVTIPKFTADGVCVCFHDDDTIRRKLRYADGSVIPEGSADDRPVSAFSCEELMRFDAGSRKNRIYAGARVAAIEEFFEICARYEMAPVLSVHAYSGFRDEEGEAHFSAIRDAAERCGVLDRLRIKSGSAAVQYAARRVFGKDIGGYILLQGQNSTWDPLEMAKRCGFVAADAVSAAESEYPLVMEYFYAAATDGKILLAEREGFPVSIATTGKGISGPEQERLIGMGVTEFTIDHHCSMGLNW